MYETNDFSLNWNRCIYVDDDLSDDLVKKLTPQILAFRQASSDPITVAINSYGGSLEAVDVLVGLITGPDQNGGVVSMNTVVTHRAYSAAANLLAFGDYAVALPHSEVLFHDVRYGGMQDVTPDKAKAAARQLQSANEVSSLKLADHVFRRLMWNYVNLEPNFEQVEEIYPKTLARFRKTIDACNLAKTNSVAIDLALFSTTIYRYLSSDNRKLINRAMKHLTDWGLAMSISNLAPKYKNGAGEEGVLDGPSMLYGALCKAQSTKDSDYVPFGNQGNANALHLFLTLAMTRLGSDIDMSATDALETAMADLALMDSINDPKHVRTATKLMLRNKHIFFTEEATNALNGSDRVAKDAVMEEVKPYAKLVWHLCLLLCRELFNGEHILTPFESQVLGLTDETPGKETIKSMRQHLCERDRSTASKLTIRKVKRPPIRVSR